MATVEGIARLLTTGRDVIEGRVSARITDDHDGRPSYARTGPYGEVWVKDGDLMREPLRSEPICLLEWLEAPAEPPMKLRVNSWTDGGRRAQVVVQT